MPTNDGKVLRMVFPELTQERRKELCKSLKALSENTKVALRNARRDINDAIKKMKKDSLISEDDATLYEKDVDKKLASQIDVVDKMTKEKEQEIMSV
jgi:ribosome recycling factor